MLPGDDEIALLPALAQDDNDQIVATAMEGGVRSALASSHQGAGRQFKVVRHLSAYLSGSRSP